MKLPTLFNVFQFHHGTIGSSMTAQLKKVYMHFNSTMVRLKAGAGIAEQLQLFQFQFHHGTIGR